MIKDIPDSEEGKMNAFVKGLKKRDHPLDKADLILVKKNKKTFILCFSF